MEKGAKKYTDSSGVIFTYNTDLSGVEIRVPDDADGSIDCGAKTVAVTGPAIIRFIEHAFGVSGSMAPPPPGVRRPLPATRNSITHKFSVHGLGFSGEPKVYDCYLTVGLYEDGSPGEVFAKMGKAGGRQGALLDCWCIGVSLLLQRGCPLDDIVAMFKATGFEPAGFVDGHPSIRTCKSPIDYIVKWLDAKFGEGE